MYSAKLYDERITKLADALSLTKKEARGFYRDINARALLDLENFKKSTAFKKMDKRRQSRYTQKRWKNATANAVWRLLDIEGSA